MTKARTISAVAMMLACMALAPAAVNAQADGTTTGAGNAIRSSLPPQQCPSDEVIRKSATVASQMARAVWLDKAAAANPSIIAAICSHPGAATILARHRHLGAIAKADHYLCRRLTRWHRSTEVFLRNPEADQVIAYDPQGIYYAIERRPAYARLVAGHVMFYKMIDDTPELANVINQHMK